MTRKAAKPPRGEPQANEARVGGASPGPGPAKIDLRVDLGGIALRNPVLTASGTFGAKKGLNMKMMAIGPATNGAA